MEYLKNIICLGCFLFLSTLVTFKQNLVKIFTHKFTLCSLMIIMYFRIKIIRVTTGIFSKETDKLEFTYNNNL